MNSTKSFLKSAGRNVIVQLLLKFAQYGLLLVVQILVARMMGKDGLGLYSWVSSLTIPLWITIEFGIDNYLVRELATMQHRAHEMCTKATAMRLVWSGIVFAIALPLGLYLLPTTEARWCFSLLTIALLPRVLSSAYFTLLMAKQRYYHSLRLDVFGTGAFAVCGVIVLPLTHSLIALIACYAAIEFAKMFAALSLYKNEVGRPLVRDVRFDTAAMKSLAKTLAPFAIVNVCVNLQMRLDVILLEAFRGIPEVGVFTAAERFVNASVALPAAVFNGLLPLLAIVAGNKFASKYSGASLLVFTGIGLIITLILFFGAPLIIGLTFQFPESITVLRILSWSFTFFMFNTISESLLYGAHLERTVLRVRLVGLALIVLTNVYFAQLYGAVGTAIATTITEVAIFLLFAAMIFSRKIVSFGSASAS